MIRNVGACIGQQAVNPTGYGRVQAANTTDYKPTPKARGVINAGRWDGVEALIRTVAWRHDCHVRFDNEYGWLSHTIRFEFDGLRANEAMTDLAAMTGKPIA